MNSEIEEMSTILDIRRILIRNCRMSNHLMLYIYIYLLEKYDPFYSGNIIRSNSIIMYEKNCIVSKKKSALFSEEQGKHTNISKSDALKFKNSQKEVNWLSHV